MIGKLSKYKSVKVVPTNKDEILIDNPLDVLPKLALISCPDTSSPYTTKGLYSGGVYWYEGNGMGVSQYIRTTEDVVINSPCSMYINNDATAANLPFGTRTNGKLFFRSITSAVTFATDTEYTIELYA